MKRLVYAGLAALAAALVVAAAAAADVWQIHRTHAGNAKARAIVLKHADFGVATGWSGGAIAPDLSAEQPCGTFHPKQSDLVVVGAAESGWKHQGIQLDSRAVILKSPTMVGADWRRTVLAPQVLPCLRAGLAKQLPAGEKLLSVKRVPFPKLATFTTCFRVLVRVASGGRSLDVFTDILAIGKGPAEITLTTIAPLAIDGNVHPAEVRLARALTKRA